MVKFDEQKSLFFPDLHKTEWHSKRPFQQIAIIHHQYKINEEGMQG